jgi:hypothetical protein
VSALEHQVAEILAQVVADVPHGPNCETWKPDTTMDTWYCTCDIAERREAAVATRVAAAITETARTTMIRAAASSMSHDSPRGGIEAGLVALRGDKP